MTRENHSRSPRHVQWTFWLFGVGSILWLLLRSGTNPRRLAYPCQRSALAGSLGFVGYVTSFSGSAHLLQRLRRMAALTAIGLPVLVLLLVPVLVGSSTPATPAHADPSGRAPSGRSLDLPGWTSPSAVSNVFTVSNVPTPECSLDGGTLPATPPCNDPSYALRGAGVDSLVSEMEARSDYFYRTTAHPAGIVGADDVVVIKINNQWGGQGDDSGYGRLSTNTDVLKGLIWRVLQHPDGFTGEVVVAENTQDVLPDWDITPANAQDQNQSYQDVVGAFQGLGYAVSLFTWDDLGDNLISGGSVGAAGYPAGEYAHGNYDDAYILLEDPAGTGANELSYPKFRTAAGHYVSMRYGVWDGSSYHADRLTFINMPVLKRHGMAGATIAWKNLIGFLTIRDHDTRYGSWDTMHDYFWGYAGSANRDYGLIGREIALIRAPDLNVVDAIWVGIDDNTSGRASRQDILVASRDPFAVDWYASEYVLRPVAAWPEDASAARAGIFRDATRANQNAAASVWPGGSYPYIDLLDAYDGDTPSDAEKNQMNAYVVGGTAPATSTPTTTATPTATSTVPASACLTDADGDGYVDVVDIETSAQDQDCVVYLPLIASRWREPWSTITPTPTATVTCACFPTPTPTGTPVPGVLQPADLTYLGAFAYPAGDEWAYSGHALACYPDGDPTGPADGYPGSLYTAGHAWNDLVGEIAIPAPMMADAFDDLPAASVLRSLTDITGGWKDNCTYNDDCIYREVDGLEYLPNVNKIVWNLRDWYNTAGYDQDSLGWSELDMSGAQGVWHIGDRPSDGNLFHNARTSNYLFKAPEDFAGQYLEGKWLIAGNHRQAGAFGGSQGPTLYALAPWEDGHPPASGQNLDALALLYYPEIYPGCLDNPDECYFPNYRPADDWGGGAWVQTADKSGILIFGRKGLGDNCYGMPEECGGDPCDPYKGYHAYPYEPQILFYDPDKLREVVAGTREPWEVVPYAVYPPLNEVFDQACAVLGAAAYDGERGLIYVTEREAGPWGETAVHVWRVVE